MNWHRAALGIVLLFCIISAVFIIWDVYKYDFTKEEDIICHHVIFGRYPDEHAHRKLSLDKSVLWMISDDCLMVQCKTKNILRPTDIDSIPDNHIRKKRNIGILEDVQDIGNELDAWLDALIQLEAFKQQFTWADTSPLHRIETAPDPNASWDELVFNPILVVDTEPEVVIWPTPLDIVVPIISEIELICEYVRNSQYPQDICDSTLIDQLNESFYWSYSDEYLMELCSSIYVKRPTNSDDLDAFVDFMLAERERGLSENKLCCQPNEININPIIESVDFIVDIDVIEDIKYIDDITADFNAYFVESIDTVADMPYDIVLEPYLQELENSAYINDLIIEIYDEEDISECTPLEFLSFDYDIAEIWETDINSLIQGIEEYGEIFNSDYYIDQSDIILFEESINEVEEFLYLEPYLQELNYGQWSKDSGNLYSDSYGELDMIKYLLYPEGLRFKDDSSHDYGADIYESYEIDQPYTINILEPETNWNYLYPYINNDVLALYESEQLDIYGGNNFAYYNYEEEEYVTLADKNAVTTRNDFNDLMKNADSYEFVRTYVYLYEDNDSLNPLYRLMKVIA